jgi:hypothetical protein
MTPDSTYRPASREPRGLARFIAGLVLLAVTAACSPGGQDVTTPVGSTLAPTPAITTSSNTTEVSSEPSSIQTESMTIQDGGSRVRIRCAFPESVWTPQSRPSKATKSGYLSLHETPASPDGGAMVLPLANRKDRC